MMLWLLMDEPIAITALFGSKYSSCSFHLIRGVIVALPGWWGGPFGVVPQKTNKADWPLWAFWVELWVASCQFGSHSWLGWRLERCWDYQSWQILYQIEMQFSTHSGQYIFNTYTVYTTLCGNSQAAAGEVCIQRDSCQPWLLLGAEL